VLYDGGDPLLGHIGLFATRVWGRPPPRRPAMLRLHARLPCAPFPPSVSFAHPLAASPMQRSGAARANAPTTQAIEAGQELVYDYGYTLGPNPRIPCLCGAGSKCRGWLV